MPIAFIIDYPGKAKKYLDWSEYITIEVIKQQFGYPTQEFAMTTW